MSSDTASSTKQAPPSLDPAALKRASADTGRNPGPWRYPGKHSPRFTTVTSHSTKKNCVGLQYGEYWVQGKRPSMEDAHSAVLDAAHLRLPRKRHPQKDHSESSSFAFFGIFDGHGGPRAAEFVAANLFPYLQAEKLKHTDTRSALDSALRQVEDAWMKVAEKEKATDGTCAAVAVIDGLRLVAASIGDSELVLSRNGQAYAVCEVHNPSRNEEEANRIKEEGGTLDRKRMRVLDPEGERSLALSRTIGDLKFKQKRTGVIAEPQIAEYTLQAGDEFLLIGCDGVWDVVQHQEAVDLCANLLRHEKKPHEVAKELVEYAFSKGSTDNISACIIVLDFSAEKERSAVHHA